MHPHPEKGTTVTHPKPSARTPRTATDIFAARRAFFPRRGTGAFSRLLALGCAALVVAVLVPTAVASADGRIGATEEGLAEAAAGSLSAARALAVSKKEGGDIFAAAGARINQFEPDGSFVRAFGWGVVPGAAVGTGNLAAGSTSVTAVALTSGAFFRGQVLTGPGIPENTVIEVVTPTELKLTKAPTASTPDATLTVTAGPGNVPTDELQELTVQATGGSYELRFTSPDPGGTTKATTEIPYDAPPSGAGSLQEALEGLTNIGPGGVSVSGGPGDAGGTGPYTIEFRGRYADVNVQPLTAANLELSGGAPSSQATISTAREGAGALETCTTVCAQRGVESGAGESDRSAPGNQSTQAIAIDNDEQSASYGDLYVADEPNFRVEKYSPEGEFLLMFGGGVDQGPHHPGDVCTAGYIAEGDLCGAGVPGTGPGQFFESGSLSWEKQGNSSIAVGPDGTVYVGDFGRIQEFAPGGTFLGEVPFPLEQFVSSLALDPAGHLFAASRARNELQGFTRPDSGTFTLSFEGATTPPISALAFSQEIEAALEALPTIGPGNVRAEFGAGSLAEEEQFEFVGSLKNTNVPLISDSAGPVRAFQEGAAPRLVELGSAGEVLHTFDQSGEPTEIAVDQAGDLFVADRAGGELEFRTFRPDGVLSAEFTSDQAGSPFGFLSGLAVGDAAGKLYVSSDAPGAPPASQNTYYIAVVPLPAPAPPVVSAQHTADVEPRTATLQALVNPSEFDTHYRFQYITAAQFRQDGEEFGAGTEETSPVDLGLVYHDDPAQAAISGLSPATAYRWRVLAESECEPEAHPGHICTTAGERDEAGAEVPQTLDTLSTVSVRGLATQTVGPELVSFKAELADNQSLQAGHWTICYGAEAGDYTLGCSEGTLAAGSGEFQHVAATFTGLRPDTTYHYQLIAHNEYGTTETADRTFTTEPSAAEERAAEERECPNVGLREENNSQRLPDCRAYEQTTEVDKEGGTIFTTASLAPSGQRVLYQSGGVFAGAATDEATVLYLAQRTGSGWITEPVIRRPAASADVQPTTTQNELNFSPELDRWLFGEVPALNQNEAFHVAKSSYLSLGFADGSDVLRASPDFNVLEGAPRSFFQTVPMDVRYDSDDLSRIFFATNTRLLPQADDPRPDGSHFGSVVENSDRIYELSGIGGPSPAIALVAELPPGLQTHAGGQDGAQLTDCGVNSEHTRVFQNPVVRRISSNGSIMAYSIPIENGAGAYCGAGTPNPIALFIHHAGTAAPVRLNAPPPSQCHPSSPCSSGELTTPVFDGLSEEGTRAWFTTAQPLVDSDTDQTSDLYLAKLGADGELTELVQASAGEAGPEHPTPGQGAALQGLGVLRVSADGSHVSFVATGVLTAVPDQATGQAAARGADNLYVYDAGSGQTRFVARLCSGPELSGSVAEPRCPAALDSQEEHGVNDRELWNAVGTVHIPLARFTPDGRYLLFSSFGRLTADDTDAAADLYRYDFQSGRLLRVSIARDGNDDNGNDDAYRASLPPVPGIEEANEHAEDSDRAISADGSTVVFETKAPLVSYDTDEANDVYEWEEDGHGGCAEAGGCVSLLSDGVDPHGAEEAIISASGHDITFGTKRGEVPGDTDGVGDIYDARIDGGFHRPPPRVPCEKENCLPTPSSSPAPPNITTGHFEGTGNGAQQLHCAKGKVRRKRHGQVRCVARKHHRKRSHHKAKKHPRRGGASKQSRSDPSAPRAKTKHLRRADTNRGGGK
jgi:hypothetical protein